jgi:hypothetical protein
MKRLFLLIVLVALVSWFIVRHRWDHVRPAGPSRHGNASFYVDTSEAKGRLLAKVRHHARQTLNEAHDEVHHAFDEARDEVHKAFDEARDDVHQAFDEARDDVHQALSEVRVALVADDGSPRALSPAPAPPAAEREEAEGLPVPIVPGTRVTEAEARPPAPPAPPRPVITIRGQAHGAVAPSARAPSQVRKVTGLISATKERAEAEARRKFQVDVVNWLDPEVPAGWTPPVSLLDAMVLDTRFEPVIKDYGTLYVAELKFDASPQRRAALVERYNQELVQRRLITLGGSLAFILICLAVTSGYIRADEATKGYYTNRLRMLAAAGVGAAGVIIYQMVA